MAALKGKEANSSQRRKDYRLAKNTKSNHTSLISKIFFLIALKDLQKSIKIPSPKELIMLWIGIAIVIGTFGSFIKIMKPVWFSSYPAF